MYWYGTVRFYPLRESRIIRSFYGQAGIAGSAGNPDPGRLGAPDTFVQHGAAPVYVATPGTNSLNGLLSCMQNISRISPPFWLQLAVTGIAVLAGGSRSAARQAHAGSEAPNILGVAQPAETVWRSLPFFAYCTGCHGIMPVQYGLSHG